MELGRELGAELGEEGNKRSLVSSLSTAFIRMTDKSLSLLNFWLDQAELPSLVFRSCFPKRPSEMCTSRSQDLWLESDREGRQRDVKSVQQPNGGGSNSHSACGSPSAAEAASVMVLGCDGLVLFTQTAWAAPRTKTVQTLSLS